MGHCLAGALEPRSPLQHALPGGSWQARDRFGEVRGTGRQDVRRLYQADVELILVVQAIFDPFHPGEQIRVEIVPSWCDEMSAPASVVVAFGVLGQVPDDP